MKPPYAESTLRRKYKATGIDNIELVIDCLEACGYFYYIIEIDDAWKAIQDKCGVTREEFDTLLPIMSRDESLSFYIIPDNELYKDGTEKLLLIDKLFLLGDDEDKGLVEDWDRFFELDKQRQGKELYIPSDLLAYNDDGYYEDSPQAQRMLRFLEMKRPAKENTSRKKLTAENTLIDMITIINDVTIPITNAVQRTLDFLELYEYKQMDKSELQQFINLFMDLSNNTRMPCNRGFRPIEMRAKSGRDSLPKTISFGPGLQESIRNGSLDGEKLQRMVMSQSGWPEELKASIVGEVKRTLNPGEEKWVGGTVLKGAKIGANDLCPCGSGKKFKKCCGKRIEKDAVTSK